MNKKKRKDNSSTPYDDVFRTLLHNCSRLLIPLINEVFGKNYTKNARVRLLQNEHFKTKEKGIQKEIISDSNIVVEEPEHEIEGDRYHFECQSTEDKEILIRMFDYGSQMAIEGAKVIENVLIVEFPAAAVLYLRAARTIPEALKIRIKTSGGTLEYDIPTIRMWKFSLEDIFEKELYLLLPFYLFNFEKQFPDCNNDAVKLQELLEKYHDMADRLYRLYEDGRLTGKEESLLGEMSNKVTQHLAEKYGNIGKGVEKIMTGMILKTPTTDIFDEGRAEGRAEERRRLIYGMWNAGISIDVIAKSARISVEEVQTILSATV